MPGRTALSIPAPIKAVQNWMTEIIFTDDFQLIDVSQAAPIGAPPRELREAMAEFVANDSEAHLYGSILGMPRLRHSLASHWSNVYGSTKTSENIAITSGCNQAFCATISALAREKDEIIIAAPWYFNQKMWLDMMGINVCSIECGANMLPSADDAEKLINRKTKAICLVSPNNPAGIEYPDTLLHAFLDISVRHGVKLVLDETYKDFHSNPSRPHSLCTRDDSKDNLIQLFSFSKSYRLMGHRVGAIITSPSLLLEIEKFLDTVTICPSQVGQYGAYWGLENMSSWLIEQRQEFFKRGHFLEEHFTTLREIGWRILGRGAYFVYVEHPFSQSSDTIARALVKQAAILCLPGTMFAPPEMTAPQRHLRIAFANIGCNQIKILIQRLHKFSLDLA